jgi:D-3-phosphoglycerate dehydrogenase
MKVLICDSVAKEAVEQLKKGGHEVDVKTGLPKEELVKIVAPYDAIVVRSATKITKEIIEAAKSLKIVVRGGVGVDNIDVEAAKKAGVTVANTPAASSISVAELAVGHMFGLARFIPQASAMTKSGKWEKKAFEGNELYGKTLGIFGIGRIGREVALRAIALGMKVIAFDPFVKQSDIPAGLAVKMADFDTVLKDSDYVTLHLGLTPETKHMLSTAAFEKMKQGVRIVNCSRGGVVDENALAAALKSGKVHSAAVDVFEKEPIVPENPLLGLPNAVLTPHLGASTHEGQFRVGLEVAQKINEFFKGK